MQGDRGEEPPPDMGRPLPVLLLLAQTCIPGRGWVPESLRWGPGQTGGKGGGRGREESSESDDLEEGSVPSPSTHIQIIILLLSAASHGTVPGTQ